MIADTLLGAELLLTGALAPCDGFHTRADLAAIASGGRLASGQPWLAPLTLEVPSALVDGLDHADPRRRVLILADPEGAPPATLVAVPLRRRGDAVVDAALRARVVQAYGATHLLAGDDDAGGDIGGGEPPRVVPRRLAYDRRDGRWRPADEIPLEARRPVLAPEQIDDLLDRGVELSDWHTPPAVARQLTLARPPRRTRGVVVFFTGLSGSGKSTVARGVADELAETGERSVTLLDGDVARRLLSKGLGFTRADRDENVRRIGTVAAEAARHGGLVLCAPIAPYAAARAAAREQAWMAGAGFVLVYMSTPLDVCEKRDRKGLYAKARLGLITGMTGIDDPYEVPTDADLVIDTSALSIEAAVATVIGHLVGEGWLARDRVLITNG